MKQRLTASGYHDSNIADIDREAFILTNLNHENIVKLHEVFYCKDSVVLILDLVTGGELFARVAECERLSEEEASNFVQQILLGVQHMHKLGVVHLDLKPENIMIEDLASRKIKIIDFGLARLLHPNQSFQDMAGTPEFCAPEIVNFDPITFATDMWAIGVLTYILLSGISPFAGDTQFETFQNILDCVVDYTRDEIRNASELAINFIQRLLIKNPKKRATVNECLEHPWINPTDNNQSTYRRASIISKENLSSLKHFIASSPHVEQQQPQSPTTETKSPSPPPQEQQQQQKEQHPSQHQLSTEQIVAPLPLQEQKQSSNLVQTPATINLNENELSRKDITTTITTTTTTTTSDINSSKNNNNANFKENRINAFTNKTETCKSVDNVEIKREKIKFNSQQWENRSELMNHQIIKPKHFESSPISGQIYTTQTEISKNETKENNNQNNSTNFLPSSCHSIDKKASYSSPNKSNTNLSMNSSSSSNNNNNNPVSSNLILSNTCLNNNNNNSNDNKIVINNLKIDKINACSTGTTTNSANRNSITNDISSINVSSISTVTTATTTTTTSISSWRSNFQQNIIGRLNAAFAAATGHVSHVTHHSSNSNTNIKLSNQIKHSNISTTTTTTTTAITTQTASSNENNSIYLPKCVNELKNFENSFNNSSSVYNNLQSDTKPEESEINSQSVNASNRKLSLVQLAAKDFGNKLSYKTKQKATSSHTQFGAVSRAVKELEITADFSNGPSTETINPRFSGRFNSLTISQTSESNFSNSYTQNGIKSEKIDTQLRRQSNQTNRVMVGRLQELFETNRTITKTTNDKFRLEKSNDK